MVLVLRRAPKHGQPKQDAPRPRISLHDGVPDVVSGSRKCEPATSPSSECTSRRAFFSVSRGTHTPCVLPLNLIRESTVLVWVPSVVEALPLSLGVEPTQIVAQQVPDFRRSCSLELRKQAPRLPSLSAGAIVLTWASACRRRGAVELCAAV